MADITKEQVVEWLSGQTVLEVADLVKELEEKW
ncbi:MAG: 50S ribosomal protein L7/L12, partial [Akkermansiaceae bacterium]